MQAGLNGYRLGNFSVKALSCRYVARRAGMVFFIKAFDINLLLLLKVTKKFETGTKKPKVSWEDKF
jgi:hypothetical protein